MTTTLTYLDLVIGGGGKAVFITLVNGGMSL